MELCPFVNSAFNHDGFLADLDDFGDSFVLMELVEDRFVGDWGFADSFVSNQNDFVVVVRLLS